MKKVCSFILAALLFALSLVTLASCNLIQAGKLSDIAGTYVLEEYTVTTKYDSQGNEIPVEERPVADKIEEYGIVEYFVITEDGYGYHVYKDNDTALYCKEVKQVYEFDDEDPALIEKITFCDGALDENEYYIQSRKHTMTANSSAWHSELKIGKRTIPLGKNDSITVRLKRVSKKQDLSYVEKQLGTLPATSSFLSAWLPDVMSGSGSKSGNNVPYENLFVYDYYVVDKAAMTATRYYALWADGEQKTETVTLAYDLANNTLKIGETVYSSYANSNAFTFNFTRSEVEDGEVANYFYTLDKSTFAASELDGLIENAMEGYAQSVNPQ